MPTWPEMQLPKPSNWQEFETIVRDSLIQIWGSPTLTKNGRPGQAQNGVDIYGPDELGRPVGIQCKRFSQKLSFEDVTTEVANAELYVGNLTTLFLATTAETDANIQKKARILSESRAMQQKFAVGILFWDDIVRGLLLNPATFKVHYPQASLPASVDVDRERRLAALELGYFGADLAEFAQLVYGEIGWMASADPDEFIANLRVLETHSQKLFAPTDAAPILECIAAMRKVLLSNSLSADDWPEVELYARRASKRIARASSLLAIDESNVMDIGLELGRINYEAGDVPPQTMRGHLQMKVDSVLGQGAAGRVHDAFSAAESAASGSRWAMRIFTLLDREIRFAG